MPNASISKKQRLPDLDDFVPSEKIEFSQNTPIVITKEDLERTCKAMGVQLEDVQKLAQKNQSGVELYGEVGMVPPPPGQNPALE